MSDPHVESLKYTLWVPEHVKFENPQPLHSETSGYVLDLDRDLLTVTMKDHYATENEARAAVEPFLQAWELDAGLTLGRESFRFKFAKAVLIDRAPSPGNLTIVAAAIHSSVSMSADLFVQAVRRAYPPPPSPPMEVTPEVEYMWNRLSAHLDRKENLLGMGYYCLTILEGIGGSRAGAVTMFHIDRAVLDKMGELTASGDPAKARKIDRRNPQRPLTGAEERWIQDVVKNFIRRLAEFRANPAASFRQITMGDFLKI